MKRAVLLFALIALSLSAFAQKKSELKGVIVDSASSKPVNQATVSLLKRGDSSLITFALTDSAGHFTLAKFSAGSISFTHHSSQLPE